ncbi:MAG TPA: lysophospholipid acyltransferase family protein [Myxococcales bacterium]|nr:lysophospholipid acyltransferase family protein [Myxococcales bacterium]
MSNARDLTALSHLTLRARDRRRLAEFRHDVGLQGYDAFGLHAAGVGAGLARMLPLYRAWFRVTSRKIRNLPAKGPAIVVANHGGLLPFDGLMLWTDIVLRSNPLRVPRTVMDDFVLRIPLVGTFFTRSGAVGGNRRNVHHLLEDGELVVIFPEGTNGIGKPWSERYRLQSWSVGHAEMAIRHRAPIVPAAIVGPDDQFPFGFRLPIRAFGAPWVPFAIPPIPLPVPYRIEYGDPIELHRRWTPEQADLPAVVAEAAAIVRDALQALLDRARKERS